MNQLNLMGSLNPTKTDIKKVADMLISDVESGNENPLSLALKIKVWEELMKEAKERLAKYSLDEIALHKDGKTTLHGAKIERVEAGVKYDYSNDIVWKELNEELETLKSSLKYREDLLKSIPQFMSIVDDQTGEMIPAPLKTSTTTIKITLAK